MSQITKLEKHGVTAYFILGNGTLIQIGRCHVCNPQPKNPFDNRQLKPRPDPY